MKNSPCKSKAAKSIKTKTTTRVLLPVLSRTRWNLQCTQCAGNHPLWGCKVFKENNPTQKEKSSAENKLCFSGLQADQLSRNCPKARKCTKPECESTHSVFLHGAYHIFLERKNKSSTGKAPAEKSTSSCSASVQDFKGLLQVNEIRVSSK